MKKNENFCHPARFRSIEMYTSEESEEFNDVKIVAPPETVELFLKCGMDGIFAKYAAHFMAFQPLIMTEKWWNDSADEDFDLYSASQNYSYWNVIRIKFPELDEERKTKKAWCVEFRPMGLQMHSHENVSLIAFVVLLSRALLHYRPDLRIPISELDKNVVNANVRDAINTVKFKFRKLPSFIKKPTSIEYCELSVKEIFMGKDGVFFGLIPIVNAYFNLPDTKIELSNEVQTKLSDYIETVQKKATGQIPTTASRIRDFIRQHPQYRFDSVVSKEINYDFLCKYAKYWNFEAGDC